MPKPRICCLDLDTFFVSIGRLLVPSLEGEPVIVRALGVRSGMSLTEAARAAPRAI